MTAKNNQKQSKTTKTKYILLLATLTFTASMAIPNADAVEYMSAIDSHGIESDNFTGSLPGVGISDLGDIYVSEKHRFSGPDTIHVYDTDGNFKFDIGSFGTQEGEFKEPAGFDFDSQNRLYVADRENDRVQVFDATGTYLFQFGNGPGSSDGALQAPSDVVISNTNLVYVIDTENNRVQVFDLDGNFQFTFGSAGSGDGQFNIPSAITLNDATNELIVTDGNNLRVQVFDLDGNFQFTFGSAGSGDGQFMGAPRYAAVDNEGKIYVSDNMNNRVQIFDSDGLYLDQFGTFGINPGQFDHPGSIKIENSKLYIVDHGNHRVQIFSLPVSNPEIILDQTTCEELLRGSWESDVCTVVDYINETKITVPDEVTLKIIGKFENNKSIIINRDAIMTLNGWGVNSNGKMINNGVIVNNGLIECKRCGFINQNTVINSGTIHNDWKMSSNDTFYNMGIIHNYNELINRGVFNSCLGEVTENQIKRNPSVDIC